jgi:hypothetical protein
LDATLGVFSTESNGQNIGGSIALGGRSYDYGGGQAYQTFAKIWGVTDNSAGYRGAFVISTFNDGAMYERMRVNYVGYVGIGTSSPSQMLDVNGNVNVVGNITAAGGVGIGTNSPATTLDVNGGLTVRNGIRPNYVKISSGTSITPASSSYGTYFDITTSTITGLTISYPASGQWANDSNGYWVFRNNTGTYLSMIVSYTAGTPTSCPSNITIPPASSVTLMATYPGGASCNYVLF